MTEAEWGCLEGYVRCAADNMGLRDWKVKISREPAQERDGRENGGTVESLYGRKVATIKFHEDFRSLDLDKQRHIVIHELTHLHLEGSTTVIWNLALKAGWITENQRDQMWEAFILHHEYGVDGIATAWAESFGFIEWPAEEKKKK